MRKAILGNDWRVCRCRNNTMSCIQFGTAEQVTITGLSTATAAATYPVTIDGTEITTSALTAASAGDLVSAFNTALSAASVDITVTSTSVVHLYLHLMTQGRADIHSSLDFSSSKTAVFQLAQLQPQSQGTGSGFNSLWRLTKTVPGTFRLDSSLWY